MCAKCCYATLSGNDKGPWKILGLFPPNLPLEKPFSHPKRPLKYHTACSASPEKVIERGIQVFAANGSGLTGLNVGHMLKQIHGKLKNLKPDYQKLFLEMLVGKEADQVHHNAFPGDLVPAGLHVQTWPAGELQTSGNGPSRTNKWVKQMGHKEKHKHLRRPFTCQWSAGWKGRRNRCGEHSLEAVRRVVRS